jgi:hypothetical protein
MRDELLFWLERRQKGMVEILATLFVKEAVKALRQGDGWGTLLFVGLAALCAGSASNRR